MSRSKGLGETQGIARQRWGRRWISIITLPLTGKWAFVSLLWTHGPRWLFAASVIKCIRCSVYTYSLIFFSYCCLTFHYRPTEISPQAMPRGRKKFTLERHQKKFSPIVTLFSLPRTKCHLESFAWRNLSPSRAFRKCGSKRNGQWCIKYTPQKWARFALA